MQGHKSEAHRCRCDARCNRREFMALAGLATGAAMTFTPMAAGAAEPMPAAGAKRPAPRPATTAAGPAEQDVHDKPGQKPSSFGLRHHACPPQVGCHCIRNRPHPAFGGQGCRQQENLQSWSTTSPRCFCLSRAPIVIPCRAPHRHSPPSRRMTGRGRRRHFGWQRLTVQGPAIAVCPCCGRSPDRATNPTERSRTPQQGELRW